jgi:hypothetical protein
VRASRGSIEPSVVANEISVPFCTAVPADSMTVAVISVSVLIGRNVFRALSVMIDSVGARSGALSHEPAPSDPRSVPSARAARTAGRRPRGVIMETLRILVAWV